MLWIWVVIGAVVLLAGVVSARMVATRRTRAANRYLHHRYTQRSGCHKSLDNIRHDCEASAQASKERRNG
jgi:hypothetical protein